MLSRSRFRLSGAHFTSLVAQLHLSLPDGPSRCPGQDPLCPALAVRAWLSRLAHSLSNAFKVCVYESSPFPLLNGEFLGIGDYVLFIFISLESMLGW